MKTPPDTHTEARPRPDRRPISVRRSWGNGDAEATVKLTRAQWRKVCAGEAVDASTWARYEGKRQRVGFRFNDPKRGDLHIGGGDCADYYRGSIAEARITGAEFPPRHPDATEFTVREGGTLEMSGITLPETRAEAYDLSPSYLIDAERIVSAADECEPLSWHLDREFEEAKDVAKAAGKPLADELDVGDWLDSLSDGELSQKIASVQAWLRDEPDWVQEDECIPETKNAQGAALDFFRDWDGEDLDALDIVIVEGAHPGSTYFAAEMHLDIKVANFIAWRRELPVWFSNQDQC